MWIWKAYFFNFTENIVFVPTSFAEYWMSVEEFKYEIEWIWLTWPTGKKIFPTCLYYM